jgi:hypothetical protein
MSRTQHEEAARREESLAAQHAAQFDPNAKGGVCFALITQQPVP